MEIVEKIARLLSKEAQKQLVFYFDEQAAEGFFREELDAIKEAGIQIIEVEHNYFDLKHRLETQWKGRPVFLYHPWPKPAHAQLKRYPLLDLLLANHELRLDSASEFLTEFGLDEHQLPLVQRYIKPLKVKANQRKLARILDSAHFNEDNLKWGLISVVLDLNTINDRNACIAAWLSLALDSAAFEKANKSLAALHLDEELLQWINRFFGVGYRVLDMASAFELAQKIKYNILTLYIDKASAQDTYARLKLSQVELNRLQAFIGEWQAHATLKKTLDTVLEQLAAAVNSSLIIQWYGANQTYGYYSQEMITEVIGQMYHQVRKNPLKAREDAGRWLRQGTMPEDQVLQVRFLFHTAEVFLLLDAHPHFTYNQAIEYIHRYTTELFGIDLHYRKAVVAFEQVRDRLDELEPLASGMFSHLNERYDRFLIDLNVAWQKLLAEQHFRLHDIPVSKQYDFYQEQLQPYDYKMVVIISDALRYELARELHDELITDSRNTVKMLPYLASIPTYTNLGMSHLLPGTTISVEPGEQDLIYRIDQVPTLSAQRGAILRKAEPHSDAITFTEAMRMNQEKGRKFFSDNRIVFVYHDWIDAVGDKKRTEHQTFVATHQALEDIRRLIRKLNSWNVYHVLVTADHGFLFNYTPIPETCRENLPRTTGYAREHSRFVIAEGFEGKTDGYVMNLSDTTRLDTGLKIAIPRAVNRYRKQGNIGLQFTHGGASLQEMLTPVIRIYRQKKELSQQVTIKRIDDAKRIAGGSIRVTLLQDQPVSNEYKSREVVIGLYSDTGESFSAELSMLLDASSPSPKDRIYEPILSLNARGSKANYCFLKVFDKEDKGRLNPLGINDPLQISMVTEKDEF